MISGFVSICQSGSNCRTKDVRPFSVLQNRTCTVASKELWSEENNRNIMRASGLYTLSGSLNQASNESNSYCSFSHSGLAMVSLFSTYNRKTSKNWLRKLLSRSEKHILNIPEQNCCKAYWKIVASLAQFSQCQHKIQSSFFVTYSWPFSRPAINPQSISRLAIIGSSHNISPIFLEADP